MRTSLTETARIDKWLHGKCDYAENLVMEANLLANPELKDKVQWQRMAHDLVRLHGRHKLKEEIRAIEHQLFHQSKYRSFRKKIMNIFKP